MAGTQQQLTDTLTAVIAAFNTNVVEFVLPYLDPNVNVFELKPPQKQHTGSADSVAFMRGSFKDHPNFALRGQPAITLANGGARATIDGKATWIDDHNPAGETLKFHFECAFNPNQPNNGYWQFTSVQAVPA